MAIAVEDHDLSFLNFEGEIPEGEYGAGMISIWDTGTYHLIPEYDKRMKIFFSGERLLGMYFLIPIGGKNWIFFKLQTKE